jgi:acetoacetyl-CoA synthetase
LTLSRSIRPTNDRPIFTLSPAQRAATNIVAFVEAVNSSQGLAIESYAELHRWSVESAAAFWSAVWQTAGVIGERGERLLIDDGHMIDAQFFPDARLSFAENLLRRRDDSDAIVFWCEERARSRVSWRELYASVSQTIQALRDLGVEPGDRVAAFMPNVPESVIGMLAASALGAVWSSCSPDFGTSAVLDRFGQIEPKILMAADGYFYGGRTFDVLPKLAEIASRLKTVETVIVVPYMRAASGEPPSTANIRSAVLFDELVGQYPEEDIEFAKLPFRHPLYILFSSGTTGVPKCIVHSIGGTLIQHLKEHRLHSDIRPNDRVFYFTTCTWMMWNWLVSALASEATLLLYEGSPFYPDGGILFDYADAERMTHFGTSAKYLDALGKGGQRPRETHDLGSLRFMASTGSPLAPAGFDYVYEHIKHDLYLASIAGGTDIVSCFVSGSPLSPVYRGEIPCAELGMAVEVWNDAGQSVTQEKGELVCTRPFPSMPTGFWGDVDRRKYRSAYFEKFPGVWAHGDFAEITAHGGFVIHGRSDAVLNPGGVRIGTAEIYREVEQIEAVVESLAIGQAWEDDVRVVLFVILREGAVLDKALTTEIESRIRHGASPRHVPAKIIQVTDIPRTRSGKIAELAVRDVVEGREVKNLSALANPKALALYRDLPELG